MQLDYSCDKQFSEQLLKLKNEYGSKMFDLSGIGWQLDIDEYNKNFFSKGHLSTTSIDANANVRSKNISTYFSELPKSFTKLNSIYLIWKELKETYSVSDANEFLRLQINGGLYLHDAHHAAYMPYCYAYSLEKIVKEGLQFIDSIKSGPAKHLNSFIQHVIQFVMFASSQSSGAVGLPDLFIWMYYFVKKDFEDKERDYNIKLSKEQKRKELTQHFQILVYSLNQPIRTNQAPFTNFTFMDRNYIKNLFKEVTYPDGELIVNYVEEIMELQKEFVIWINNEREKQMFTFPVMTASLIKTTKDFNDQDAFKFITKYTRKWQDFNIYISDSIDSLASCCRLTSSTKLLKEKDQMFSLNMKSVENKKEYKLSGHMNSIGGSDLNIGSFKVLTINLPRIALEYKNNDKDIYQLLYERIDLVQKSLYCIRNIIKDRINRGALPLYDFDLMHLDRQYGTIGINGVWEFASMINGTEEAIDGLKYNNFGELTVDKIMNILNKEIEKGYKKYRFTFNIEQVPAEKAAVTLAEKDKLIYGKDEQPYELYSNQWIPLIAGTDLVNRIYYSGKWDKKVGGGAILHLNLDKNFDTDEEYANALKMLSNNGVIYFAFNNIISVCEDNHAFYGNKCPVCGGEKVDEYMRIVGYLVPVSSYNNVRREKEYPHRQFYNKEHTVIDKQFNKQKEKVKEEIKLTAKTLNFVTS